MSMLVVEPVVVVAAAVQLSAVVADRVQIFAAPSRVQGRRCGDCCSTEAQRGAQLVLFVAELGEKLQPRRRPPRPVFALDLQLICWQGTSKWASERASERMAVLSLMPSTNGAVQLRATPINNSAIDVCTLQTQDLVREDLLLVRRILRVNKTSVHQANPPSQHHQAAAQRGRASSSADFFPSDKQTYPQHDPQLRDLAQQCLLPAAQVVVRLLDPFADHTQYTLSLQFECCSRTHPFMLSRAPPRHVPSCSVALRLLAAAPGVAYRARAARFAGSPPDLCAW